MLPPRRWFLLLTWSLFTSSLVSPSKKATCHILGDRADCSHLSLSAVPSDLPENITILDMSHNRLVTISPTSLSRYKRLIHLDLSYNSITKLGKGLCRSLPALRTLNLEHNEVHLLKMEDLSMCGTLAWLNMANNRLKLEGEPFSTLQNLKYLDVSKNQLVSARLGSRPQLPQLINLRLGHNDFTSLKKDDFSFLSQSPSLQILNLSSVPLKTVDTGSFKPLLGLQILILDGSDISDKTLSKLFLELSETAINTLFLRRLKLVKLRNGTFSNLQKANLTLLDLSANGMTAIEDGSFQYLSQLRSLVLSTNNINRLTKATFEGLEQLTDLQLVDAFVKKKKSPLAVIDDYSFHPLKSLKSLSLVNSRFKEVTEHTFTGLTSLAELDLSWTGFLSATQKAITDKTFASLADSPLKKLNLAGNALTELKPGDFSPLRSLTTLVLDHNFIKQDLRGGEFEGLSQIQELHLSDNFQNINLTSQSFANLSTLRVLTLGKSLKAEALNQDPSPFRPLTNLSVLDISNNNIANIRKSLLEGLVNLRVLKIQHNNLARLWKMANLGGPVLFLEGLEKLETLEMNFNGLDEIPTEALRGLFNLKELSIGNNLLNNLKPTVFDDLKSLRTLRLEKNTITTVRPEVFQTPMSNLSLLEMGKNPFDCTCASILWFVTWLNSTNTTSVPGLADDYRCNTPLAYFNKSIMDFDPLFCKDMTPFQALYILSSTIVLATMWTALLVRFHGWRIEFYWNILINRTLGFSDTTGRENDYEYDAYIIHAEEDANWVSRRMIPLENEWCRFCLEDRDSSLGMSKLESIINNMRASRKILFVVTESLLKDPWCRRFKAHHALHQVIEASRDSVVLVFLQDVHDYRLSRALYLRRGMLRSRCVLEWPAQKERIQAFHQKLLIALGMSNRLQE